MTSRYVCLSLVLLALCLHGSFAAPQNRMDGENTKSRIARQVTSSLTAEDEKTEQMKNDKLIKEGQKASKDQTIDLLNNFKALLNNNIKQDKVKPGNIAQIQNVGDTKSTVETGEKIKVLTKPSQISQILRTPATTTTTTTTTTTQTTTTQTTTTTTTPTPDLVGQIVNGLSNGFGRLGSNMLTGAGFAAAAASPLWAPLLIGKKRRRRDLKVNTPQQILIDDEIETFGSSILQKFQ